MNATSFNVLASPHRLAMPIATYPVLALTGATVGEIVTQPQSQLEAQAAQLPQLTAGVIEARGAGKLVIRTAVEDAVAERLSGSRRRKRFLS
jgi:hypothetical protein